MKSKSAGGGGPKGNKSMRSDDKIMKSDEKVMKRNEKQYKGHEKQGETIKNVEKPCIVVQSPQPHSALLGAFLSFALDSNLSSSAYSSTIAIPPFEE